MHTSVKNHFIKFNEPIEHRVEYMYLDIKGLVTIGVGNLIDIEKAGDTEKLKKVLDELVTLPFVYKKGKKAGKPASKADIEAEWKKVKARQELVKNLYTEFAKITILKLNNEAIDELAMTKLMKMEKELKTKPAYRDFEQWPADAQLGLLSMAWALGATRLRLGWPNFRTACQKQDFDTAAKQSHILDVNNPGVGERNTRNQRLFKNAAAVLASDNKNTAQNRQNRQVLHFPHIFHRR